MVQKGWEIPYDYEATPGKPGSFLLKDDYYPGDLSFDPLGLTPATQEDFEDMQLKELSHCRLAMIAAAGMVAQELVDGKGLIEHFTSSALSTGQRDRLPPVWPARERVSGRAKREERRTK